jgi:hypothetical protein
VENDLGHTWLIRFDNGEYDFAGSLIVGGKNEFGFHLVKEE